MTRIVTSTYRYKRPPRKRKPVMIEAPAVVTPADPKKSRRPVLAREAAAAEEADVRSVTPRPANDDGQPVLRPNGETKAAVPRKSAIVTVRDRKTREQQQMAKLMQDDEPK